MANNIFFEEQPEQDFDLVPDEEKWYNKMLSFFCPGGGCAQTVCPIPRGKNPPWRSTWND